MRHCQTHNSLHHRILQSIHNFVSRSPSIASWNGIAIQYNVLNASWGVTIWEPRFNIPASSLWNFNPMDFFFCSYHLRKSCLFHFKYLANRYWQLTRTRKWPVKILGNDSLKPIIAHHNHQRSTTVCKYDGLSLIRCYLVFSTVFWCCDLVVSGALGWVPDSFSEYLAVF